MEIISYAFHKKQATIFHKQREDSEKGNQLHGGQQLQAINQGANQ